MSINKITRTEYPDLWDLIMDDYELASEQHRRGSNFFVESLHTIDAKWFPNNPELHGLWISDTWVRDVEYGSDLPDTLYRVEKREREVTTTVTEYIRVGG